MSHRGFTLIELLVACLLLTAVTAAVAAMAVPARSAFERTLGAADLTGGSRAALERLAFDLREAGRGATVAVGPVRLADVASTAVPFASLDDMRVAAPAQAIKLTRIGRTAPQGVLVQAVTAGATTLQIDTSSRCTRLGPACGLTPGMSIVVFDAARAAMLTVGAIGPGGFVQVTSSLPIGFGAGAVVAETTSTVYGLRANVDGSRRLVRANVGGAEQPLLQNVVDFQVIFHGQAEAPQPAGGRDPWATYGPAPPRADEDDPRDTWGAGENCTITRDANGGAIPRLSNLTPVLDSVLLTTGILTDGPWCADALDLWRFDADLLRVRSIEIRLRVESASANMRGPVGRLFRRPGTATDPARWVPDVELRLRVGVRNAAR